MSGQSQSSVCSQRRWDISQLTPCVADQALHACRVVVLCHIYAPVRVERGLYVQQEPDPDAAEPVSAFGTHGGILLGDPCFLRVLRDPSNVGTMVVCFCFLFCVPGVAALRPAQMLCSSLGIYAFHVRSAGGRKQGSRWVKHPAASRNRHCTVGIACLCCCCMTPLALLLLHDPIGLIVVA
jgi:hypothetical protein